MVSFQARIVSSSGGEISEALDGSEGQIWKDGGEVVAHRDTEPAGAFDSREACGDLRPDVCAAYLNPVASFRLDEASLRKRTDKGLA